MPVHSFEKILVPRFLYILWPLLIMAASIFFLSIDYYYAAYPLAVYAGFVIGCRIRSRVKRLKNHAKRTP